MSVTGSPMRVGLGTYRIRGDAEVMVRLALSSSCLLIDTAANYRGGRAHAEVARAIQSALADGALRDSCALTLTTKIGYAGPSAVSGVPRHTYDPVFLRREIELAAETLAPAKISCLYLHNPEEQSGPSFETRLAQAFEVCESARDDKLIGAFGIASWDGFVSTRGLPPLLTVGWLDNLATSVAGASHGLRCLQMPISLVRSQLVNDALSGQGPLADASLRGWRVYASSPLHGGSLPQMLDEEFLRLFPEGVSAAQACLLFASSVPGVSAVLTSSSNPEQLGDSLAMRSVRALMLNEMSRIINVVN